MLYKNEDCSRLYYVCNLSDLNITKGSQSNGMVAYYAKEVITDESSMFTIDDFMFINKDGLNHLYNSSFASSN